VRFVFGIFLARVLFPEQFGLIGMLTVFMAVAMSLVDGGFWAALIQRREITTADTCSIFYFNITVGALAAGLLCWIAPWIAEFYGQPILTPLMRVLSLVILVDSFGQIHGTILTKQIDFKAPNKISLFSSFLSGLVGVTLALAGFGVWSLAIQQVAGAIFRTGLLWCYSSWRPALIFRFNALNGLFRFGSRMLLSALLVRFFDNLYSLVIGKFFSATDLGFFSRARVLQELPSQALSEMVGLVTIPAFATIQNEPDRIRRGLKKALTSLGLLNFPMMIGVGVVARPLVLVLLTEKWAPCISYLQLLCICGLLFPLEPTNMNVLIALGRSDLFLRIEVIKKLLVVLNILITWRYGITAMIYGIIVISFINYFLSSWYNGMLIGYAPLDQLRDLLPYLIMSLLMGAAVYGVGCLPFSRDWLLLLVQVSIGAIVYFSLCRCSRLEAFMEMWKDGWSKISARKIVE
jgi:teichuronic acid exporter